ncbi:LamG-like jellyroll fold domain-containing protein [Streptomyces sp. NPDC058751]|uniref:LamG-like jellyroll fold domain-containing protein n=1 Tax=Streptomyces sp. NPDC058751 TaxID=3346623 RepID=UPI0036B96C90
MLPAAQPVIPVGIGEQDHPTAASAPVLDTSRSYTVSAWANLSSLTAHSTFVSQSGTSANGLQLYYSSGAHVFAFGRAHADDTGGDFTSAYGPTTGAQSPRTNTWFHLVGLFGRRISKSSYGEYADGKVADVQLFTEALTPGGVASLSKNRPVPTQLS